MRSVLLAVLLSYLSLPCVLLADGPSDNVPEKVRPVPKPGIEISAQDRQELTRGLDDLTKKIHALEQTRQVDNLNLLPDVQVFLEAVRDAVEYNEFFKQSDVVNARKVLEEGSKRADSLLKGEAPWTSSKGLVVRAYVSKIDGSIQPYGLVVPSSFAAGGGPWRLDVWFHGRDEALSKLKFVVDRMKGVGTFAPKDTIVLHPYGRYCNANKFAGEVDTFEAIDDLKRHYRIDDDRTSVRGFSMGGAACWHFAVHHADRWFAANPGAGFADTPKFLHVFQNEKVTPTWYEQKLWHLYDCPEVCTNLINCPTVAYSGEIDKQKQAADLMAEALKAEGIELEHVIGPKTAHAYQPQARLEVERRMDDLAVRGRDRAPKTVSLTTYTLKYNRMHWLTIDALAKHWERARVMATIDGPSHVSIKTENAPAITLDMASGFCPWELTKPVILSIDGQSLECPQPRTDRSWRVSLHRESNGWVVGPMKSTGLVKRHDLQGPIDDAFMSSFIFVLPSGRSSHEKFQNWVDAESKRAITEWRRQFRGVPRVKLDKEVTDADIASSNLVLWGDPGGNSLIGRIADRLPIAWNGDEIAAGKERFPSDRHALILAYPNPLNPQHYVVLNSGFTFREYDYLNNARQVPRLPDWAIVDLNVAPDSRYPGKIAAANFFGESWELLPLDSRSR